MIIKYNVLRGALYERYFMEFKAVIPASPFIQRIKIEVDLQADIT